MVDALGRRVAAGDPDGLGLLRLVEMRVEDAFAAAVQGWRASGFTDGEIGRELGVTRQAVQKRWPR